jgi:hypothetical protein
MFERPSAALARASRRDRSPWVAGAGMLDPVPALAAGPLVRLMGPSLSGEQAKRWLRQAGFEDVRLVRSGALGNLGRAPHARSRLAAAGDRPGPPDSSSASRTY